MRWRRTFLEGTGRRERLDVIVVTLRICHAHMQSRALCSYRSPSEAARGESCYNSRGSARFMLSNAGSNAYDLSLVLSSRR